MSTTTRSCLFVVFASLSAIILQAARVDRVYETDLKEPRFMVSNNCQNEVRTFCFHENECNWPNTDKTAISQSHRNRVGVIDDARDGGVEDNRYYGGQRQRDEKSQGSRGKGLYGENVSDFETLGQLLWKIKSGLIKWLQKIVELE
ncbi:hypothetical protein TcWFU_006039 [Taenia crassiceps]|uniref:Uncharacterized protein n=1 Tax=Taenia crassiceps TaxID=6207 RepID=A0ABR4QB31_9CEST